LLEMDIVWGDDGRDGDVLDVVMFGAKVNVEG
jgi:hypothetical protein